MWNCKRQRLAGMPAAPGLYFMRLEAGAFAATRRVTLLR